jgi:hypothetical protein
MQTLQFRSNGKLMISGEYLVLAGARALAIPVRYGQSLTVQCRPAPCLQIGWSSRQSGREWFRATFHGEALEAADASDGHTAKTLQRLLIACRKLNPAFLSAPASWQVETELEFDRNWGLGSSSTLVSNLALWAGADPYRLLFATLGGSGYDLACARSHTGILYKYRGADRAPEVSTAVFRPSFSGQLGFVYTGRKQDTPVSLSRFSPGDVPKADVREVSRLSLEMAGAGDLASFMDLMSAHERIVGRVTGQVPVQPARFPGFEGALKSLGAWGGDFLLAASPRDLGWQRDYFKARGLHTFIPFDDMILKKSP